MGFRAPRHARALLWFLPFFLYGLLPLGAGLRATTAGMLAAAAAGLAIAFWKLAVLGLIVRAFEPHGAWRAAALAAALYALMHLSSLLVGAALGPTLLLSLAYLFLAFGFAAARLREPPRTWGRPLEPGANVRISALKTTSGVGWPSANMSSSGTGAECHRARSTPRTTAVIAGIPSSDLHPAAGHSPAQPRLRLDSRPRQEVARARIHLYQLPGCPPHTPSGCRDRGPGGLRPARRCSRPGGGPTRRADSRAGACRQGLHSGRTCRERVGDVDGARRRSPSRCPARGPSGRVCPPEFVAAIAQTLSVPELQLRQEWSVRPLEEVARAHGADPATLARTLKARWSEQILRDAAAGRVPPNDVEALRGMQEQLVDGWLQNPLPTEPALGRDQSAPPGPPMVERTP